LSTAPAPTLAHTDRLFIDGAWVAAGSAGTIDVLDSTTEEIFLRVPAADVGDVRRAVGAARAAFDDGPWPRLAPAERANYLRAIASALEQRAATIAELWPRESGVLVGVARAAGPRSADTYRYYADLAGEFDFVRPAPSTEGPFAAVVREPVGVVGAIVPWNVPLGLITAKLAPALLAGCTVVLKASPEAPGEAYLMAEIAEQVGLPAGVLNVLTADRDVSEQLVRDPRVDKIAFTGSTAAGRRIASLLGERIGRYTLELGGKSAAVILDDADVPAAAAQLAAGERFLSGQVCSSLTRIVVTGHRHDELVEALAAEFSATRVGDPFDPSTQMGPLASAAARERVESYIRTGVDEGARLVTGGGRPAGVDRGYFVEPTIFCDVDNHSTIAQQEIFGPVLSVVRATDEADAVRIANDTIYGLNASVFTHDADRAWEVARALRSGTVGHNGFVNDMTMPFGGFKQSGIGRERGVDGLLPYLETKSVILQARPGANPVAIARRAASR